MAKIIYISYVYSLFDLTESYILKNKENNVLNYS